MAKQSAGNNFQQYQQATSQLLNIQQQQKAAIAQASSEEAIIQDKNNQLLQASGHMAQQVAANNVLAQQVELASQQGGGGFNPATVGTLSQYGLGQPKQVRSTTSSSSNQRQTKQKVTINNKTENIIYNDVRVPANIGGPVQGRPIQITSKTSLDGGLGKFKSWLDNTFNQQAEDSARRQREYRKKDAELTKQSNKMIRELDNVSKSLGDRLDPKHIYRDIGSAFKNVLILFGIAAIARSWPKIINSINNIENNVRDFFDNRKERMKALFSKDGAISTSLVKIFGGKPGETVGQAFRGLLFDKKEGLFAYIRKYLRDRLEERSAAIKTVKKPNFDILDLSASIGSLGTYLADILAAILDPKASAGKSIKESEKKGRESTYSEKKNNGRNRELVLGFDEKGNKIKEHVYDNDRTLVTGEYTGLTKNALNDKGELTKRTSSYYSQSTFIDSNISKAKNGFIATANVGVGFERLYKAAQASEKKKIPVSTKFVNSILSQEEINNLGLKPVQYTYVIRERSAKDVAEDLKEKKVNSDLISLLLSAGGATIGTILAGNLGMVAGTAAGAGIGTLLETMRANNVPRYQYELVSPDEVREDDIIAGVGKTADYTRTLETPLVYEVSPEAITKIVEKFSEKSDINIDINDKEYMSAIEQGLLKRNESDKVNKPIDLDKVYAANDLYMKHEKEESDMWDNSRMVSAGEGFSEVVSDIGDSVRDRFSRLTGGLGNFKNSFGMGGSTLINSPDVDTSSVQDYKAKGKASSGLFTGLTDNERIKKFINILRPAVKRKLEEKNLSPNYTDIVLAQMATETGWGAHEAGAFNFSGIKAPKNADGTPKDENHAALLKTTERLPERNPSSHKFPEVISISDSTDARGRYLWTVKDYFRTFDSLDNYLNYYIDLLNNSNYRALSGTPTVDDYVNRLTGGSVKYFTADPTEYKKGLLNRIATIYKFSGQELPNQSTEAIAENNNTAESTNVTTTTATTAGLDTSTGTDTDTNVTTTTTTTTTAAPQSSADFTASLDTGASNTNTTTNLPETTTSTSKVGAFNKAVGAALAKSLGLGKFSFDKSLANNTTSEIPEIDFENSNVLPEVTVVDYAIKTPVIETKAPKAEEKKEDDKNIFIMPVAKFTEKLIDIDKLLTLMVDTSGSNLEATMNVLDALTAKKSAENKSAVREIPSISYTDLMNNNNNTQTDNGQLQNIFYTYNNIKNNTQG